MMSTVSNPQIDLAFDYVTQTRKNIFLTGKAGTGKTTFLHRVKREAIKRMAVVAPTGVAAINAQGVTIHSLFQLPFGPLPPGKVREQMSTRRFSGKKISLIKSLDLLVIDEISMVRADVLDAIDEVLRRYRSHLVPFGGVQLLMIGDLHQLPPVVKNHEWDLLKDYYQTPYFFGSLALQKSDAVTIELKHIYRQSDNQFIDLLNKVRDNRMDDGVLAAINSRYQPDFYPGDTDGYITLSSHNATAKAINSEKLRKTDGKELVFKAIIEGDFPEHSYPTEMELKCKVNAQVMFVKNDLSEDKRFYNGKIGRITRVEKEIIYVLCPGEEEEISVEPAEWSNRKYNLDESTKEISEEIKGTFTQYPLKLAWAITIHKSQGLTFERVVIDAQAAFAHGQVYVALSRCKTFEGIVLRTKLMPTSVKTDVVVQDYTVAAQENEPGQEELLQAKKEYQQGLLRDLFRFESLKKSFKQFHRFILENEISLQGNTVADVEALDAKSKASMFAVSDKFLPHLEGYLIQEPMPDDNEALIERLKKAGGYFDQKLNEIWETTTKEIDILTDNKAVGKRANQLLQDLTKELFINHASVKACVKGFDSKSFARMRVDAELDFQKAAKAAPPARKKAPKEIVHPSLYQQLVNWRSKLANEQQKPHYTILPTRSILEIVHVLPTNLTNLKRIHGIGKSRANTFGEEILEMVTQYTQAQGIETDLLTQASGKAPKLDAPQKTKSTKQDTKAVSLGFFKSGKNIQEIASERGFAASTIEGHLAHFVGKGELDIFEILEPQKVVQISGYFTAASSDDLGDAKGHFGNQYSYGELKLVREHWRRGEN